jgi:uncharacterized SAM-binding protein YcdF (DUF218 family)
MRRRRRLVLLLSLAALAAGFWYQREHLLRGIGDLLIADDPLEHVEAIVVSQASGRADAFEAARLYHEGLAEHIVLPTWVPDPLDAEVRCLGLTFLSIPDLARAILERTGVPPEAIVQLPDQVDGSETEVAAVAKYLRTAGVTSVLYIAPRSHGARIRWMLRRRLPSVTRVVVRGPLADDFARGAWWRSRDQSREVMSEGLRWANTLLLGDAWREPSVAQGDAVRCSCCGDADRAVDSTAAPPRLSHAR